jgi:hypothetical protein
MVPATSPAKAPTSTKTMIELPTIVAEITTSPFETPVPYSTESTLVVPIPSMIVTSSPLFLEDSKAERLIVQAKKDLHQITGIPLEKINIVAVEAVEWPDGSLGCGTPGVYYLQVTTPGFLITLEAGGQLYSFNTDTTEQILLCTQHLPLSIHPTP